MTTLANSPAPAVQMDALALNLAKKRSDLADILADYDGEILAVHRRFRARIVNGAGAVAGAHDALISMIDQNRECFANPKSWTLHGQQFGLRKGSGKLEWDDADKLITRIEREFSEEEAELLIRTKKEPIVDALKDLDAKVLARLGVRVEGVDDVVFIKAVVTGADKLLKVLLKEGSRTDPKPEKAAKIKGKK